MCGRTSRRPRARSSGSIQLMSLAASSRDACRIRFAVLASICQGPSISLPRHQNLTPCGFSQPCARRRSDSVVPPGWLQYSTRLRAASPARVPRLTASIGSMPAARHQSMNSLVPNWLVSVDIQARSSRRGRSRDRPDAVLPIVAGDEVAARIAHDGRAQAPARGPARRWRKPLASAVGLGDAGSRTSTWRTPQAFALVAVAAARDRRAAAPTSWDAARYTRSTARSRRSPGRAGRRRSPSSRSCGGWRRSARRRPRSRARRDP